MEVKFKKLDEKSIAPIKSHDSDACFDLTCSKITTEIGEDGQLVICYHSGIAIELPENTVGLIFPRSSIFKKSLTLTNCVGVIDSGYRGEIISKFKTNTNVIPSVYKEGERYAQLMILPLPSVTLTESEELKDSDRGDNGFGSSDKKDTAEEQKNTSESVDSTPTTGSNVEPSSVTTD